MTVSYCGKRKTTIGTRDLYKLSEWKKSVVIACKWVFADKDGVKHYGTEVVNEIKKRIL